MSMATQHGSKNPNWKGGRSIASNGYVLIRSDRQAKFLDYQATTTGPLTWRVVLDDRKGGDPAEWPVELRVRQFPEVRL